MMAQKETEEATGSMPRSLSPVGEGGREGGRKGGGEAWLPTNCLPFAHGETREKVMRESAKVRRKEGREGGREGRSEGVSE